MSPELAATVGFVVAAVATLLATPVVIAAAVRTDFYDHPHDYHQHLASTPLLGGAAVMAGFLLAAVAVGVSGKLFVLLGCALAMWAVGTVDDRTPIAPAWRLLPETAAAVALVLAGLGWRVSGEGVGDFVLTVLWVVGLVNAFNLMDNLDGACGTVAAVSALGIGTLAAIDGGAIVAGLAFSLAGACLAFLRWNLAGPAKIFLGDGGSRPIGLLVAGLAMVSARRLPMGDANVLVGAMLAGLVILDTALVTVSRTRRGVTVMTGGRDHLTHRLLLVRDSPGTVAAVLAIAQATLCALAIAGERLGTGPFVVLAVAAASSGVVAIAVLETPPWRPPGIAVRTTPAVPPSAIGLVPIDRQ
jgi:UDP-GlcNAc:undecaprenyl-phosphate/decaprenyl-phosphate GlcNAc-1-phosphate transferase